MKKTNKETVAFRHELVDIYKVSVGCCICGYNKHPSALCFDHLPECQKSDLVKNGYSKHSSAGGMYKLYYKWVPAQVLIEEIKKCRVVCSNCHMELTHSKNTRTIDKIIEKISLQQLQQKLIDFEHNESKDQNES